MKKLLSIFAATTLAVSAPLSVVACKKGDSNKGKEFDYDALKKQLIDETTEIIKRNLDQDFTDFLLLENQAAQNKFESISIKRILDILNEQGTNDFKIPSSHASFNNISKDLKNIVDIEKLKNDINKNITQNINFKPILVNSSSPFSGQFETDSIQLIKKSDDVVSIIFKFDFQIQILEADGGSSNNEIFWNEIMNIFNDVDIAESLNQLSISIREQLESDKYVNSMSFISNSGNFLDISETINSSESIKSRISEAVIDASEKVEQSERFSIDVNNSNLITNKLYSAFGSGVTNSVSNFGWDTIGDDIKMNQLISTLTSNGNQEIENFARKMAETDGDQNLSDSPLYQVFKFVVPKEIREFIEKDTESSWSINHYHIDYFLDESNNYMKYFTEKLAASKFKIDKEKDKKTIAIWGTDLKKISLTYKENGTGNDITIEMPNYFIVNRQITSFENTIEYAYNAGMAWLKFCREFLGYSNFDIGQNPDFIYNLTLPEEILNELEVNVKYDARIIQIAALENTRKKLMSVDPDIKDFINTFYTYPAMDFDKSYYKINSNGYIYSLDKSDNLIEMEHFSFGISGTGENFNLLLNPSPLLMIVPKRLNSQPAEFGEAPTRIRLKDFSK